MLMGGAAQPKLTSWSHGARAWTLHRGCHLSWGWHSPLHGWLHERRSAVDVHPALPRRDTGSQGHPDTQACAQLGEPQLALPVSPAWLMCCSGSYYGLWLG